MPHRPATPPKPVPHAGRGAGRDADPRIRIVVADTQAIDRAGLVLLLEGEVDFEVLGEAATVEDTIQQCAALEPQVLVLSLNLSGQQGGPVIPALRASLPGLRMLALSERASDRCLVLNPPSRRHTDAEEQTLCSMGIDCLSLAVEQGAMATLRRTADPEELFRAIRAVAKGEAWYDATTASGLLSTTDPSRGSRPKIVLSARELQVAALIAEGRSNKEISSILHITGPTVKKHVGRILGKLGLDDRLQAGLFLARNPTIFGR